MTDKSKVRIERFPTGVPGLDTALGGGLPEFSFNMIAGEPGAGKTTLSLQLMFALATPERPALYFTLLGEPTLKLLRHQQQFDFFKPSRVGRDIHFINLSDELLTKNVAAVLERITSLVEEHNPGVVVVDSFRTVIGMSERHNEKRKRMGLEEFVQRLSLQLSSWEVTSFLVSEFRRHEGHDPVFTVADGIIWMLQDQDQNSVVRKVQIVKMRGQAPMPGMHTFRITEEGVQVFPRLMKPRTRKDRKWPPQRVSSGVAGMDEMLGGGLIAGDALVLAGPTGSGKTTFAMQFIADGLKKGEAAMIVVFEEHPETYLTRARALGVDFRAALESGKLQIIYLSPFDLSVDETLFRIDEGANRIGASRIAIDSLSGFEVALAPTFRRDFRQSLYRLVRSITAEATVMMTIEVVEGAPVMRFTEQAVSFLTDDIIIQRYVEIDGEIRTILSVVKMRGSSHSRAWREYRITEDGIVLGESLAHFRAIGTGMPYRAESMEG